MGSEPILKKTAHPRTVGKFVAILLQAPLWASAKSTSMGSKTKESPLECNTFITNIALDTSMGPNHEHFYIQYNF